MNKPASRYLYLFTLVFSLWALSANTLSAQSDAERRRFKKGLRAIEESNWSKAREFFAEVKATEGAVNGFSPEAEYYYSLCCLRTRNFAEAEQLLIKTLQKSQDPKFQNEGRYLLGNICFELKKPRLAVYWLSLCGPGLAADAGNMKRFYLNEAPADTLRTIYKQFNRDAVIIDLLGHRLAEQPLSRADKGLAIELAQKLTNLPLQSRINALLAADKGIFKVALLLPFNYRSIHFRAANRSSQFILDLYSGITMAAAALADSGIGIELYVYDTEKREAKIKQLLNLPEMKEMDLLVGPVYTPGAAEMAAFADSNHIVMVNPLSNKPAWEPENQYAYLTEPSVYTISQKVAKFAKNYLDISRTSVIRGNSAKDSILAYEYRQLINNEGGNMALFRRTSKNSAANLVKHITEAGLDSTGHLFVPNDEQLVQVQLVSALELLKLNIPFITYGDWLFSPVHTLKQWEERHAHFIFPDFLDYDNPAVAAFRDRYTKKENLAPSKYAYMGSEMMLFFGRMLGKAGSRDIKDLLRNTGYHKGQTMLGFNYKNAGDNQIVPIYKIDNGQMVLETVSGD
ncbi:MAG: ABC transporter substrate-binding protein [Bacteroidota bacterium]